MEVNSDEGDTKTLSSVTKVIIEDKNICFLKILFIYFREKGKEREREGERHRCERETSIGCLLYAPIPETEPVTQVCALTGNHTSDLSLC